MLTFGNLKRLGLYTELENQSAASKSFGKFAEVANIAKNSPFRTLSKKLNLVRTENLWYQLCN